MVAQVRVGVSPYDLAACVLYARNKGMCVSNRKVVLRCYDEVFTKGGLDAMIAIIDRAPAAQRISAEEVVDALFPEFREGEGQRISD